MLLSPCMGHLITFIKLAKRLVLNHGFSVTFTIPTDTGFINSMFLSPVYLSDLPADASIKTIISLIVSRSLISLSNAFMHITSTHRVFFYVVDTFATDTFEVANEFNIKPYVFFQTNAMVLAIFSYFPKMDEEYSCECRDVTEPIKIPGSIAINGIDLPDSMQDRKNEAYAWVLITPSQNSGCLKWLDDQPVGSVLFVSFGSGGKPSSEQLNELALGIEMSEHRFLWVTRSPSQKAANATFFNPQSVKDPFNFLRVLRKNQKPGMIFTHCRWNSTHKGVVHGVPLITWRFEEIHVRSRMTELKSAATSVLEENGSSAKSFKELANVWKKSNNRITSSFICTFTLFYADLSAYVCI
ncbi:hypothetical protein MKW94_028181 [Papaver nudicaule]|uniref:Uncharacterized protein n=1 Tax=Papaver nudicaule TaxID=74823 RepID=A0AA41RUP8_PAPNU|nr:hypothetical protein [Papaver nudicaule]